ncbi:Cpe/LpqF family protein [Nonomuraea sp. NPDC050663]|uniref:Cpe/LpqF family protein n=1 Tax=Nonomuraea sp. NPDC050663 TaxID=3364370 RepID=UPI0037B44C0F
MRVGSMLVALLLALAGCAESKAGGVVIPDSAVGKQLQWYLDAVNRTPLPESELAEHLGKDFIQDVPPAEFNEIAGTLAGLKVDELTDVKPDALVARVSVPEQAYKAEISVDGQGKIGFLLITPQ